MSCQVNSTQILHNSSIQPVYESWESFHPSSFLPSMMDLYCSLQQTNSIIPHLIWSYLIDRLFFFLSPVPFGFTNFFWENVQMSSCLIHTIQCTKKVSSRTRDPTRLVHSLKDESLHEPYQSFSPYHPISNPAWLTCWLVICFTF